jgi:hypothetical protein
MRLLIVAVALVLVACDRPRSTEDVAADVADDTARQAARSVAREVSAEQYREIDERLDALEEQASKDRSFDAAVANEVSRLHAEDRRLDNNQNLAEEWAKEHLTRLYNGLPPPAQRKR